MLFNLFALIYLIGPIVGLWFVFKKAGIAPWKAIIPVYNIMVWIKVCGKDWKWYIYFLIPAINVFTFLLLVVETAKAFNRHRFLEQAIAVLVPFAYLPWLGLGSLQYSDPNLLTEDDKKELKKKYYSKGREWADAIVFALIAAVIIRGHNFELYNIPSSSMEKSLMVGDYLMVSKSTYGSRSTMTPLSFPLVHNVLPFTNQQVESYLPWIKFPYHRFPGIRKVGRFDAVVFNYPDGDTVCTAFQSNRSYHDLVREYGRETVLTNPAVFGKIVVRPVDKRENFIKRCIALPGETLEIRDQQVLIDGKPVENPDQLQFLYAVLMSESFDDYAAQMIPMGMNPDNVVSAKIQKDSRIFASVGISNEDISNAIGYYQYLMLTPQQLSILNTPNNNQSSIITKYFDIAPMQYTEDSLRLVRISPRNNYMDEYNFSLAARKVLDDISLLLSDAGVSQSQFQSMGNYYTVPLTQQMLNQLKNDPQIAKIIPLSQLHSEHSTLFPHAIGYNWSVDNFGPVTIPQKGATVQLTVDNLPIYKRVIEIFEHNTLEVKGDQILINGKPTNQYTFKMDYYWMMGDNRHNSADSRYWGFVPEDHIVGRASMVLLSRNKDNNTFRWGRTLKRKF